MLLKRLFNKQKIDNMDYESTLKNNGIKPFNKDISLLNISDTHGDLALNKEMQKKINNINYDLCCILGDIHDYDYKIILEKIPKEKIVVILGNHDRFSLLKEYGLDDFNGKVIDVNGIKIGAIQGSFKYKEENFPSFTYEESINFLQMMPDVDILLSHDKPLTFDYRNPVHDGLKWITKFLYDRKVPINIHGHIHKSYLDELKNGTQVKDVYCIELIKIKKGKIVS